MRIAYSRPLNLAWRRTGDLLWRPFDLGRWFVLGFAAFLSGLVEGGGVGGSSWNWHERVEPGVRWHPEDWPGEAIDAAREFMSNAWLAGAILWLVLLAVGVGVLVAWIGSRGQFVFVDSLVRGRAAIAAPWRDYRDQGNSLFRWQLAYWLITLIVLAVLAVGILAVLATLGAADAPGAAFLLLFLAVGSAGFAVVVALAYVDFFLLRLVVPIMHCRRISCTAAWGVFGREFRARPWPFVLYGLLHLGINLAAAAVIVAGGLLTCCVGLLVLAIPYLGTVLILPLPVFLRHLDLAWLGQFGQDLAAMRPAPDGDGPNAGGSPSGHFQGDGAVVGPQDVGADAGGDEPGPQDP